MPLKRNVNTGTSTRASSRTAGGADCIPRNGGRVSGTVSRLVSREGYTSVPDYDKTGDMMLEKLCEMVDLMKQQVELSNYTLLCDSADPSIYYLAYLVVSEEDGTTIRKYIIMPAGTEVDGELPSTAVTCQDPKVVDSCWKVDNGDGTFTYYTNLICIQGTTVVGNIRIRQDTGEISTDAPVGAVRCDEIDDRTVTIVTDCAGTTEDVDVQGVSPLEVVLYPSQVIKVVVDKSCDPVIESVVLLDCDDNTETVEVDQRVSIVGSERNLPVILKEVCETALQDITPSDCDGALPIDKGWKVEVVNKILTELCPNIESLLIDCDSNTEDSEVDATVAIAGSIRDLPIRIQEICESAFQDIQWIDCDDNVINDKGFLVQVTNKISAELCERTADVIIDCANNTESVTADARVVIEGAVRDIPVIVKDICDQEITVSGVDCDGLDVGVLGNKGEIIQNIPHPEAVQKVEHCPRTVQTIDDCDLNTSDTDVDQVVSIAGSSKPVAVRVIEDCESRVNIEKELVCVTLNDGCEVPAFRICTITDGDEAVTFIDETGDITANVASWVAGPCGQNRIEFNDCWLPDQYAIQWSRGGNGDVSSYDALTDTTTYYGQTDPGTGVVGGYALAFKNDAVEPTLYFQVAGTLYKADPADPIGTFTTVGSTSAFTGSGPGATSSYPCFDFIDGRLLVGDGNRAWQLNEDTGESTYLGQLIDVRDGANLSVAPGDWFSDPNGDRYMMARDNRGASFTNPADGLPYCTGTALWKIDKNTLEATRISPSCSPTSGTGASWLAANLYLLSTSSGIVYQYNKLTDVWSVYYDADDSGSNVTINDLAPQRIIPDPIAVYGWVDKQCVGGVESCEHVLFTLEQQPDNSLQCVPFATSTPGKFQCEKDPNPFVSDPFDSSSGGGSTTEVCTDQVWHEGCSDAGAVRWRRDCDGVMQYIYTGQLDPVGIAPAGFKPFACDDVPQTETDTVPFCNEDVNPNKTVYRQEKSDGTVEWFDETGMITEPTNKTPGQCPSTDPLVETLDQVICFEDVTYVRREIVVKQEIGGIIENVSIQVIWFNGDGTFYDSGVQPPTATITEPGSYTLGDCTSPYIDYRIEKLCEIDDEKLLLIDSGGAFAEYSFTDGSLTNINTISVPSAGGSADPDNFLLYNFVAPDQLYVTDVNTKVVVNQLTLFTNDGSPLSFSAAAFDINDGFLYSHNNSNIYRTDVNTGEVSLVTPLTGVAGSGTSMAIDANGRMIVMGSLSRVYEIDRGTGAGTLIYTITTANVGNGSTFDADPADPRLYVTSGNNTVCVEGLGGGSEVETLIIDSRPPGANSLAYYRTLAQEPSCFYRRYGVLQDGTREYISDHFVSDFSDRVVSGAIICCECKESGGGSTGPSAQDIADANEATLTYKGPTAQEIAQEIVIAQRNVQPVLEAFQNTTVTESLSVPAGTRGRIVSIEDTGAGSVYWTIDGTVPSPTNGFHTTGPYHSGYNLQNVDLSQVRLDGTSGGSDYYVAYEIYL